MELKEMLNFTEFLQKMHFVAIITFLKSRKTKIQKMPSSINAKKLSILSEK